MRRRRLVLGASLMVAMLIAALATACGGDDATSTPIPTTAPTSTPTKAPTATPVPPSAVDETQMEDKMGALTEGSVLIALNPQNDSGQSGWATLTARGSDTEVVLSLSPGAMESKLVHIHEGACGNDTLGGVLHGLTDFSGGTSTTLVESVSLDSLLQGNLAINSHNINDPSVYTACGNIPSKADTVTIALNPQNDSGQSGWATLTARGSDTEVVLSLSPGAMESKLVHIHEGACGNDTLGGVLHGLTDFSGGTSSTLLDGVLLESLLGGDLAVNAHNINDPSIYTACGNIPSKGDSSAMMEDKEAASITLKNFEFVPDALEVEAGKVARFTVTSEGAGHTFTIESLGVDVVMPAGTTETIEFDVPEGTPGEIQLKCRFHGSGGSGMVATIRVKGGGPGSADAGKDGSTTSEVPGLY